MECNLENEEVEGDKCGLTDIEINIINGNPPDWWTRHSNWPAPNGSMSLISRLRVNYRNLPDTLKSNMPVASSSSQDFPAFGFRIGPPFQAANGEPTDLPRTSQLHRNDTCIACCMDNMDSPLKLLPELGLVEKNSNFFVSVVSSETRVEETEKTHDESDYAQQEEREEFDEDHFWPKT